MHIGGVPTKQFANIAKGPYMPTPGTAGVFLETYSSFPTELAAWSPFPDNPSYRLGAAALFYSNDYDPSLTHGQAIYWFIAMAQDKTVSPYINYLIVGEAYVANASVSTTPVVYMHFAWELSGVLNTIGLSAFASGSHNQYSQLRNLTSQDGQDAGLNWSYFGLNNSGFITMWGNAAIYLDSTHVMDGGAWISYNTPGLFEGVEPVANFPEVAISQASNAGITPGGTAAPYDPDKLGPYAAMRVMSPKSRENQ